MAQPANTFSTYDSVGIREDLSNIIYNIDPTATPLYSRSAKTKARNTVFEWMTQALRNATVNANVEGDATTAQAVIPTVRLQGRTQIFKNAITISGTDNASAIDNAGRQREMAYQSLLEATAQKLDIELALFANTPNAAGSNTVARTLGGIPSWLVTNVSFNAADGGANPVGDGTNARTDASSTRAFTQALFDTVMQDSWTSGAKLDTCYLSPTNMTSALAFEGNNNQRSNVQAGDEKVIKSLAVYVTPWGTIEFMPSRMVRASDVILVQSDMWCCPILRPTKNTELARNGDNETRQIITELGFESKNQAANGAVYDVA